MSATPAKFLREENVWRDIRARVGALKKREIPVPLSMFGSTQKKKANRLGRVVGWLAG